MAASDEDSARAGSPFLHAPPPLSPPLRCPRPHPCVGRGPTRDGRGSFSKSRQPSLLSLPHPPPPPKGARTLKRRSCSTFLMATTFPVLCSMTCAAAAGAGGGAQEGTGQPHSRKPPARRLERTGRPGETQEGQTDLENNAKRAAPNDGGVAVADLLRLRLLAAGRRDHRCNLQEERRPEVSEHAGAAVEEGARRNSSSSAPSTPCVSRSGLLFLSPSHHEHPQESLGSIAHKAHCARALREGERGREREGEEGGKEERENGGTAQNGNRRHGPTAVVSRSAQDGAPPPAPLRQPRAQASGRRQVRAGRRARRGSSKRAREQGTSALSAVSSSRTLPPLCASWLTGKRAERREGGGVRARALLRAGGRRRRKEKTRRTSFFSLSAIALLPLFSFSPFLFLLLRSSLLPSRVSSALPSPPPPLFLCSPRAAARACFQSTPSFPRASA